MLALIDYNMGNITSVANAFSAIGEDVKITSNSEDLKQAKAIILPGVGAFADGMENLKSLGVMETLHEEVIEKGKPYLGICLGLQFLATKGHEHVECNGFGWIKGTVRPLNPSGREFKVPHIGWNNVSLLGESGSLYDGLGESPVFYFVHSFHFVADDKSNVVVTAVCSHGEKVVASIQQDNIFGVQFHPEKSQGAGLRLIKNFANFVNKS